MPLVPTNNDAQSYRDHFVVVVGTPLVERLRTLLRLVWMMWRVKFSTTASLSTCTPRLASGAGRAMDQPLLLRYAGRPSITSSCFSSGG